MVTIRDLVALLCPPRPLVVGREPSVTAAAAMADLGLPVTTVRISWKPIAGVATGMQTNSRGLVGLRRSMVALPDQPHRPDDVVTVVAVLMPAATEVWEPPLAHPAVMPVPRRAITLAGGRGKMLSRNCSGVADRAWSC